MMKKDEKYKEKMAFSLFCMYYYKFKFSLNQEDYLVKLTIIELKELWKLGKLKNKLNYFFNLAEKFYEVDFSK